MTQTTAEERPPTAEQGPIRVATGPRGRGVFATRPIAAEELLETCPTLEAPDDEVTGVLRGYVFRNPYRADGVVLMLGFGSLYNHADTPNVTYAYSNDREVEFRTTRAVAAGEELLIAYGESWWRTRDEVPV